MNLCLNLALSWVGKRVFVPPTAPTAVSFQSLTANGTSGTVSTTQLTATLDIDPGLTTANFVVTGASKGVVSKVGAVYTVNIHTITVEDGQSVTLAIINVPSGFTISPLFRTVIVYREEVSITGFRVARNTVVDLSGAPAYDLVIRASQTTGPAPMGVVFNMLDDSTFPGIERPEAELSWWFDYGDAGSTYQNVSDELERNNANKGQGAIHGHVFESVGSYTVKAYCYNHANGQFGYAEVEITATDADTHFSGANTICLDPSGVFAGAPAGSTQVTTWAAADAAMDSAGFDTRLMLARGQTILADSIISIFTGAHYCSFGSGDKPIITYPGDGVGGFTDALFLGEGYKTSTGSGLGAVIYDLDIRGDYSSLTGAGESRTTPFQTRANTGITFWRNDVSGIQVAWYPRLDSGIPNKDMLFIDNKVTDWNNFGIFPDGIENSAIIGNSIEQNINAISGPGGRDERFGRIDGDGITLNHVLPNLWIYGDEANMAVFDFDIENEEYTELKEIDGDFVFIEGIDDTGVNTGNGTHQITLTTAIAENHELYYHTRYWARHGPIRLANQVTGVSLCQNQLLSMTSWTNNGLDRQPCLRWSTSGAAGSYGFINQNRCISGFDVFAIGPESDGVRQRVTRPLIVESNLLMGNVCTNVGIRLKSTNTFIRNNIIIQSDVPTIYSGQEFGAFLLIDKTTPTLDDVDAYPIEVHNNSVINLMSTANGAKNDDVLRNVDGVTHFPLVSDSNNLLYHEDRPTPLPVDYSPLDPDNYYQPLAGSPAIDAGTPNSLVWDDFSGELVGENASVGAFDKVGGVARKYLDLKTGGSAVFDIDVPGQGNGVFPNQGLRFKIITSDVTTSIGQIISASRIRARPLSNSNNGAFEIQEVLAFFNNGVQDFNAFEINLPNRSVLWDGEEHVVKMPLIPGDPATIILDGVSYTHPTRTVRPIAEAGAIPRFPLTGIGISGNQYVYDVEIYDVATDETLWKVAVNSGLLSGLEAAEVGGGGIAYSGTIVDEDWTETPG